MPYKNPEDRRKQVLRWSEANRERSREIKREWAARNRDKLLQARAEKREATRTRDRAEWKFRFAVHRGWVQRPDGKHFHHPDYSRPYFGAWVTPLEHRRIHAGMMECPPCIDYTEEVETCRKEAISRRQANAARACNQKRWGK